MIDQFKVADYQTGGTFLRQGPQLQQRVQPSPQLPRQGGHTQLPAAAAAATSSPCRLRRHIPLQGTQTIRSVVRLMSGSFAVVCMEVCRRHITVQRLETGLPVAPLFPLLVIVYRLTHTLCPELNA